LYSILKTRKTEPMSRRVTLLKLKHFLLILHSNKFSEC